ncbi:MAG TPA: hypothetical protein DCM40_41555 [Maribacter sp.]|jgi:hypothetical protein|nr:hypothetical protein [Maribacter sp.]|tara:strand:- start:433 stop:774 length:342 start_codon:yes stop_codon:yes gene_type:complete
MTKYLKNPFVIAGIVGLAFYLYKRKQILSANPEASKPIEETGETQEVSVEETDSFDGVPTRLKKDVSKMDKQTLKRTIITNQKMLKRARISDDKRKQIQKALDYLKREYKLKK